MRPSSIRLLPLLASVATLTPLAISACADEGHAEAASDLDSGRTVPVFDAGADSATDAGATASVDCTKTDFCPVSAPLPAVVSLNAVWGSSATDVWAVGTRGTILHGDGTTFTLVASGTDSALFAVGGTASDDVWVAGSQAPLHSKHLLDGGTEWERVQGELWEESWADQGRTWAIWGSADGHLWIAGRPSQRFNGVGSFWSKGTGPDGGVVWNAVEAQASGFLALPTIRGLWGIGANDVWGVGQLGAVFRYEPSTDATPARWTERNSLTIGTLESIWGFSATDIWTVGQEGVIRHLTDDPAQTFAIVSSPTKKTLHAIWGSGPSDIWAAGDDGMLLHYDGDRWSIADAGLADGFMPDLYGIWGSGPNDVWIVGEGVVLHRSAENRKRP